MTYTEPNVEDQSAVSLEDLEAYLARNVRPILQSVVPEQQRVTPPFTAGSTGQPPTNVDETGGNGDGGQNAAPHTLPANQDDVDDGDEEDDDEVVVEGDETPPANEPSTTPPIGDGQAQPDPFGPQGGDTTDDLIEVSPGVHMTRAAISLALANRPQEVPTGGDGSAAGEPTSAPAVHPTTAPVIADIPAIPQEILDDPELAPIVQMLQSQQSTMQQQNQALSYLNDIVVTRETEAIQARVVAGINKFKADKNLDDAQITAVNQVAARLQVMPILASGIDPITGATVPRDAEQAAFRALEIAFWQMPEHREAAIALETKQRAKDSRRKQRLAGVAGGSGSVQRTTTVPTTRHGREAAAVVDLREMMNPGQGEE